MQVRAASSADYSVFVRLFPELGVDDAVLEEARFVTEIVPTALIAERESGGAVGYAYFQLLGGVVYVRHVITAPEARRRGAGRALMSAIASRARDAGCTAWCLNVKPENTAAIALYEWMGMSRAFASRALKIDWANVEDDGGSRAEEMRVREIAPEDDARVEVATRLVSGQLAAARALGSRLLLMLEDAHGAVAGAAVFDPRFPGAYPFRVLRSSSALVFLRAMRVHARASDVSVRVVVEDQPAVAEELIAHGAIVLMEILQMKGPLPDEGAQRDL